MKKKKQYGIIALVLILVVVIAAGYYFYINRFDASAYVKAVLDVSYKNEIQEYVELTDTSEKEAKQIFENNLNVTMEEFDSLELPDELSGMYRELFENIAKKVNYTVGEGVKDEDGNYTVEVMVKPITLFDDTYDTFQEKAKDYAEQISNDVMGGAEITTDEQMQNDVYQIYYEVLKSACDAGLKYGEAEKITLHVVKTEEKGYEIQDKDMQVLDSTLISEKELATE